MQVTRDIVRSPTGEKFVVAFAQSGGIDTTAFWAGPLYPIRKFAFLLDAIGWVQHRVNGKGRWTVAVAKLGNDGHATALIHSSSEPDRRSARDAAQDVKRQIQTGAIT